MLNKTQLPEVMRAVEIKNPGGPEMLVPVQVPLPKLRAGEILIKNEENIDFNQPLFIIK